MKCPHCGKDIKEHLITQEAARIMGRRSKRHLSTHDARAMGKKGAEARWGEKNNDDKNRK
jgi:hypothetical protein